MADIIYTIHIKHNLDCKYTLDQSIIEDPNANQNKFHNFFFPWWLLFGGLGLGFLYYNKLYFQKILFKFLCIWHWNAFSKQYIMEYDRRQSKQCKPKKKLFSNFNQKIVEKL